MIERLPNLLRKQVNRAQLIVIEEQIIRALDFDLQSDGPLPFLERYQRVMGIDQVEGAAGSDGAHFRASFQKLPK